MYRYTDTIRSSFGAAQDVKQVSEFWNFMENDFVDGIYEEKWYNEGDQMTDFPCPGNPNATGE
jgi:hypothetical protein